MSDFYTFVTSFIFNNPKRADEIEKKLKENANEKDVVVQRMTTEGGSVYFAGYFKNLGGGPWPEIFIFYDFLDLQIAVMDNDGKVYNSDGLVHQ